MATISLPSGRPLLKKLYVKQARVYMYRQGFGHEWVETYARQLGDEIDAAATEEEFGTIRDRVFALAKSPPPVAWIGA